MPGLRPPGPQVARGRAADNGQDAPCLRRQFAVSAPAQPKRPIFAAARGGSPEGSLGYAEHSPGRWRGCGKEKELAQELDWVAGSFLDRDGDRIEMRLSRGDDSSEA